MSDDMVKYYRNRAKEYEQIYEWRDHHRQEEQDQMEQTLKQFFTGVNLLDVGCGTGYWTQRISETARSIVGIDINQTVLDIAASKTYGCPTEFKVMDAYRLDFPENSFDGALASFWLSHIPREDIDSWLRQMHRVMKPGSRIMVVDNSFIEGIGGRLVTKRGDPNTYKLRTLGDGSEHLIVKNYFTVEELVDIFSRHTREVTKENVFRGSCFWWISYEYE